MEQYNMFWCHNSDEFKLQILEPSDISNFFFSPDKFKI